MRRVPETGRTAHAPYLRSPCRGKSVRRELSREPALHWAACPIETTSQQPSDGLVPMPAWQGSSFAEEQALGHTGRHAHIHTQVTVTPEIVPTVSTHGSSLGYDAPNSEIFREDSSQPCDRRKKISTVYATHR